MAEVTDVDIVNGIPTGGTGTVPTLSKSNTLLGSVTEAAPATDTASSGVNGRLQRIAQRLTSTIALLPAALGAGGGLKVDGSGTSLPVTASLAAAQTLATVTTVSTVTAVTAISSALPAGTNLLGKVKTKFVNATASALTRPANQTPYTANDAVSDNATAGSVTAKSVTLSDVNDDLITIERVRLATTDTGAQGKAFRMYLYNSDPTASSGVTGGDNAAFSNKQAGFIGTLSGTFTTFSDGGVAVLVPDAGSRIVAAPTSGAKTVFWQLQTLDAFTSSANSTTFTPTFECFQGAA